MPSVIDAGIVTEQAVPPAPQLMPAPVTFPPVGTGEMVSVYGGPVGKPPPPVAVKVALHVFAASTSTLVVALVPLHAPPQLVNVYPVAAAAVSVAVVVPPNVTAHVAPPAPHVSPLPVTVPPDGRAGRHMAVFVKAARAATAAIATVAIAPVAIAGLGQPAPEIGIEASRLHRQQHALIGQAIDSVIFILVASVFGVFPWSLFTTLVLKNYIFKVLIEVVMTTFAYRVVTPLKKDENEEQYDRGTGFNLFEFRRT